MDNTATKQDINELAGMVKRGFDGASEGFEQVAKRFEQMEERFEQMARKLDKHEDVLTNIARILEGIELRLSRGSLSC